MDSLLVQQLTPTYHMLVSIAVLIGNPLMLLKLDVYIYIHVCVDMLVAFIHIKF